MGDGVGRFADDRFSCVVDAAGVPEIRLIDQHFDLLRDAFVYCDRRSRAVLLKVVVVETVIPIVERTGDHMFTRHRWHSCAAQRRGATICETRFHFIVRKASTWIV
jgi:hypothetical protein